MIKRLVCLVHILYIVLYDGSMNVFHPIYKDICLGNGVFIMRCDNLTVCVLYVFV